MNYDATITNWIAKLGKSEDAVEYMFNKYFNRLIALAVRKTRGLSAAPRSPEDVALSAINSFCLRVRDGKIVLSTENELWACLFRITTRKACAERRRRYAARRGGNQNPANGYGDDSDEAYFNDVVGREPSPELATELAENADELLALFESTPTRREVVALKLQGLTVEEIAAQTDLSKRTVFWHLNQIQEKWTLYKSLEYLFDNLFDQIPFETLAESLDWPTRTVVAVVEKALELWTRDEPSVSWEPLRLRLFSPREFFALCRDGAPEALRLEENVGTVRRRWTRRALSTWGAELATVVKKTTSDEKNEN